MAAPNKIDSNRTEARWSEELSVGVANGSAAWVTLEVNNFSDAKGQFTKVARNPIGGDRQLKKGQTTDLDAHCGFNTDLTQFNMQDLLQGLFFADLRRKAEFSGVITSIITSDDSFNAASGLNIFAVNDLFTPRGLNTTLGNGGLHRATAVTAAKLTSDHNLTDETPPATGTRIVKVGIQVGVGLLQVDSTQPNPALVSNGTTPDWTAQSLTPGEYVWIGGDTAITQFATAANNCLARIRSITSTRLELDKTTKTMVTDAGTAKTIQVFYGRVLKNESSQSLIKRRTYQIERQLGAPDEALPAQIQSEYFVGSVFDSASFNYNPATKITIDPKFMSTNQELRTGVVGLKAGTRPAIENADAQVTSSDLKRCRIATVVPGTSNPAALYSFIDTLTVNVSNNSVPQKALTVLGAYDYAHGDFKVGGSFTGTFFTIDGVAAIKNNTNCTIDIMEFKNNAGWVMDMPLVCLGDGSLVVEKDKAIKNPVTFECASGEEININLDYTLAKTFFDFLPNLAATP